MRRGEVYENPASGERVVVLLGPDESESQRLMVDLFLRPRGGITGKHYHPAIHERFKVIEGTI